MQQSWLKSDLSDTHRYLRTNVGIKKQSILKASTIKMRFNHKNMAAQTPTDSLTMRSLDGDPCIPAGFHTVFLWALHRPHTASPHRVLKNTCACPQCCRV